MNIYICEEEKSVKITSQNIRFRNNRRLSLLNVESLRDTFTGSLYGLQAYPFLYFYLQHQNCTMC